MCILIAKQWKPQVYLQGTGWVSLPHPYIRKLRGYKNSKWGLETAIFYWSHWQALDTQRRAGGKRGMLRTRKSQGPHREETPCEDTCHLLSHGRRQWFQRPWLGLLGGWWTFWNNDKTCLRKRAVSQWQGLPRKQTSSTSLRGTVQAGLPSSTCCQKGAVFLKLCSLEPRDCVEVLQWSIP